MAAASRRQKIYSANEVISMIQGSSPIGNSSDRDEVSSTKNDEVIIPIDVVKDAGQAHPYPEEDISDDDDDPICDPDYIPSCDKSSAPYNEDSLSMVATTPEQQDKDEDEGEFVDSNNTVKRKRNKHLSPGEWKQNESKGKRLKGMSYKSKSGKEISAKAMGPPCNSKFCQRETAAAPSKSGPKSGKHAKLETDVNDFLKNWLKDLPTVDSHYCRSTETYKDKKFLYMLSRTLPMNISQAEYDAHIIQKDKARQEKSADKDSANNEKSVWTMDLQAVLLCPKTQARTLYYKTKLQVHNFTLFDLRSKEGYCYIWDESEGDLSVIRDYPELKEIIVWSDGCGYQNHNACVANAFSELARKYGVLITQKFLVAGHTQMECDSMHSTIERKIVTDVLTPRDYVIILQTARIRPSPYHVKVLKHFEFLKMNGSYFTSIRPGRKAGDPTVHHLRALQFSSEGNIHFKLSFSEDSVWEELPQRVQVPNEPIAWIRMFPSALPIKERKFQDLQSMKHIMPIECHHYFDNLPHE
ncbi:hypothetical protein ABVT39_014197 [Epinephelus coioides]